MASRISGGISIFPRETFLVIGAVVVAGVVGAFAFAFLVLIVFLSGSSLFVTLLGNSHPLSIFKLGKREKTVISLSVKHSPCDSLSFGTRNRPNLSVVERSATYE